MKHSYLKSLFSAALIFSLALLFTSSSGGRAGAANDGNVGAPGEGADVCGSCHNGGIFGPISEILSILDPITSMPVAAYEPGVTYNVTMEVAQGAGNPFGFGFQVTALDAAENETNEWSSPGSNVQISTASLVGGRTYVEHNEISPGGLFEINWTAPTAGTGDVTFYFAGNVVDGNGATTNDVGGTGSTLVLSEFGATGIADIQTINATISPNPVAGNLIQLNLSDISEETTVWLYNLNGNLVITQQVSNGLNRLDISGDLPAGVYILEISSANKYYTEKLVVL